MRRIEGRVVSGFGVAASNLAPKLSLIEQRTRFSGLLPGTLNVRITQPFRLKADAELSRDEYYGYERVFLQRCRLQGIDCLIVRPETHERGAAGGPAQLELMSTCHLRTVLGLSDGSLVVVEVEDERPAASLDPPDSNI